MIVRYDHPIKENDVSYWQDREPEVNGAIVAAIQTTFNRSRLSRQSWESGLLEGRVDARRVWRSDAKGAVDIFRERHAPSVTKVNLFVIIDSSGSMNGTKITRAQDLAATLAKAFQRIPSVRLQVWQHNALGDGKVNLYRVYAQGVNRLASMRRNVGGGNADGFALQAIGEMALRDNRPGEKTIVWMISDGLPSVRGNGDTMRRSLAEHSTIVAEALRAKGCMVIATAIEGFNQDFVQMYGPQWIMEFKEHDPSAWITLSQEIAKVIGRVLAHR